MIVAQKLISLPLRAIGAAVVLGWIPATFAQSEPAEPRPSAESLLETPASALDPAALDAPAPSAPAPKPAAPASEASAAPDAAAKAKGTTITAEKEATFDNEERKASFSGNVKVTDPEFNLTCDKLNVFLSGSAEGGNAPAGESDSALRKAIAEGNVVVVQRRVAADGTEKLYRGKAEYGVYDATTGEFALTGWPEVKQGINSHIGTEKSTRITITKDGRMKTDGPSRTVIEETPDES